jgi:hypothetical protein
MMTTRTVAPSRESLYARVRDAVAAVPTDDWTLDELLALATMLESVVDRCTGREELAPVTTLRPATTGNRRRSGPRAGACPPSFADKR